jgi:hypothetical protein
MIITIYSMLIIEILMLSFYREQTFKEKNIFSPSHQGAPPHAQWVGHISPPHKFFHSGNHLEHKHAQTNHLKAIAKFATRSAGVDSSNNL